MKLQLLKYGSSYIIIELNDIDRITARDESIIVYFKSGKLVTGYMLKPME